MNQKKVEILFFILFSHLLFLLLLITQIAELLFDDRKIRDLTKTIFVN